MYFENEIEHKILVTYVIAKVSDGHFIWSMRQKAVWNLMGFQTAFVCGLDLVFVQVQIGFVFDAALAFVLDGNVQLLFAAFEF